MVSRKLKALVLAALVLAATVGVVWYFFQEHGTPSHLIELDSHSLPNLKDAFNRASRQRAPHCPFVPDVINLSAEGFRSAGHSQPESTTKGQGFRRVGAHSLHRLA
jgi:hypothetical protein